MPHKSTQNLLLAIVRTEALNTFLATRAQKEHSAPTSGNVPHKSIQHLLVATRRTEGALSTYLLAASLTEALNTFTPDNMPHRRSTQHLLLATGRTEGARSTYFWQQVALNT